MRKHRVLDLFLPEQIAYSLVHVLFIFSHRSQYGILLLNAHFDGYGKVSCDMVTPDSVYSTDIGSVAWHSSDYLSIKTWDMKCPV
jgi:hypothetical protein